MALVQIAEGQVRRLQFGFAGSAHSQFNAFSETKISAFGSSGLDFVLKLRGEEDYSTSYHQVLGFWQDRFSFNVAPGNRILYERFSVNINPSVAFPSRWNGLSYLAGIGALICIGSNVGFSSSTASTTAFQADVDSIGNYLESRGRRLNPFISAGLEYALNDRWHLQLSTRQSLLSVFPDNTIIGYRKDGQDHLLKLAIIPTNVGFRVEYYFLRRADE